MHVLFGIVELIQKSTGLSRKSLVYTLPAALHT